MSQEAAEATASRPEKAGKRSRSDTRERLIAAAILTLQTHGITGTSARGIAAAAGVNQALVFYHFESMDTLLAEACHRATEARIALYRSTFAEVSSLRELLAVGRELHDRERAEGNVSVLAQLLAAGQNDPALARATANAVNLWVVEVEAVLTRLLRNSPLAVIVDPSTLARAVAAAFIGLELYEGVDPAGGSSALQALDQLGALVEVIEELGPVSRRALRAYVRRAVAAG